MAPLDVGAWAFVVAAATRQYRACSRRDAPLSFLTQVVARCLGAVEGARALGAVLFVLGGQCKGPSRTALAALCGAFASALRAEGCAQDQPAQPGGALKGRWAVPVLLSPLRSSKRVAGLSLLPGEPLARPLALAARLFAAAGPSSCSQDTSLTPVQVCPDWSHQVPTGSRRSGWRGVPTGGSRRRSCHEALLDT